MGTFKLAWRYVQFHKYKTLLLVACIFLATFLPIAVKILLGQFNEKIVTRAQSTPTAIGAKGSRLDLTLNALYFQNQTADTIAYGHCSKIRDEGWGQAIPVYCRHTATGKVTKGQGGAPRNPIVGTTLDYFLFRELEIEQGQSLSLLGDCVLGAEVAERLGLKPGDRLASDSENILDISGSYPLNMLVRGVLKPTATPDDKVIFVDLKTAWIIDDLGHGHQSAESIDEGSRLQTDGNEITTNAAVSTYTEINESNMASFHFHGDMAEFPISAIIGVANSTKSETLMIGYFDADIDETQIVIPIDEVRKLMGMVFKVEQFFQVGAFLIALSTLLLLALVVFLSLRLRRREMETMFKLGCSRSTIAMMQVWELAIVFFVAAILIAAAVWAIVNVAGDWVQQLLLGS